MVKENLAAAVARELTVAAREAMAVAAKKDLAAEEADGEGRGRNCDLRITIPDLRLTKMSL